VSREEQIMTKPRQQQLRPVRVSQNARPVPGLAALDFLERSREMADDPVMAGPRPVEAGFPLSDPGTG
jgi:hypothetical protein